MTSQIETTRNGKQNDIAPGVEPCPIERGMRILGGKWKGSILWHLKDKPVRFNELSRLLSGASKRMINERLKELEVMGLVNREVVSERPIAVQYSITEFGRSALKVLNQLKKWTDDNNL